MKCIITAGPTYEPLDEVRRLTNFSTGRLGSELATFLSGQGHEVILLIGQQATWRGERKAKVVETFGTTADLKARLLKHASNEVGAVFHAAAVSDFGFGTIWHRTKQGTLEAVKAGKVPTNLEGLLAELVATPKIIGELRRSFPGAWLIGWKYEMDGGQTDVINKAIQQISANGTDACVANGRAYGDGFGLVQAGREPSHYPTMQSLFEGLAALMQQQRKAP
ncbi:MAG TPA: phosphopantothenoylcysteine decarboxylase [Candidatus Saccharimonadales bacterium]|nr:phosphopantothenoylcysteine decarboxylase [Candidatus Saccharimonadales bacterium]